MHSPPPSNPTLDYYESHAERFAAETADADMTELYAPFLALVPPGGHILDAGCGPGRDALAFNTRGFHVTAFDGSPTMVRLAERATGHPVQVLRFQEVDFAPEFDGVWACASLLHVPRAEMGDALARLGRALRPKGVLFISFKLGGGETERGGRWFTDYTVDALRAELGSQSILETIAVWETADVRPSRMNERWVNALAQKQGSATA